MTNVHAGVGVYGAGVEVGLGVGVNDRRVEVGAVVGGTVVGTAAIASVGVAGGTGVSVTDGGGANCGEQLANATIISTKINIHLLMIPPPCENE